MMSKEEVLHKAECHFSRLKCLMEQSIDRVSPIDSKHA
jgi:hypothetical protein